MGVLMNESTTAYLADYTSAGSGSHLGKYIGYTDSSFTWLGLTGPTLREILFLNRLPANYASLHSMGLAYSNDNEGSMYPKNSVASQNSIVVPDNAVAPGECVVYKWLVNEGSGPTNAKLLGASPSSSNSAPMPQARRGYGNESIWQPQMTNLISANQLNSTQGPTSQR
ncbi:uncharacterized protein Z518_08622 [Rhinocladiella mackenziei CBS 650.93]|uniref:Plastocyanin-like domain-containing protein n=1 Tax=Rhinocladiella mackenziei CBS 650.93 TaxID=1442369 RepID=A0A0D2J1B5_9EURO|nr:uncharacterized protein Z518_08622 [Rhinocladiella mackenziei CBS 650.93]KIX02680.1 hypothetical protein Z518_08622 [Rhinocladiella mackenziei CBS 650.93]